MSLRGGRARFGAIFVKTLFSLTLLLCAAAAEARPYRLLWDANFDGVTAGYRVFYGSAPGAYQPADGVDVGNVNEFQVDLIPGQTYYFAVRAYDNNGEFGPASDELSFAVPLTVPTISVTPATANPGNTLTATIASAPGNSFDVVALYPVGGSTASRIDWKYLNNQRTPPGPGMTAGTVTFTAPSSNGNYEVRLYANESDALLATSTAIVVAPTPTLRINDVSTAEGNSGTRTLTFTVTLSPVNSSQTVTVNYATANGTATTANSDYVAASGTLSFSAGQSSRTFAVTINGDTTNEANETFVVNLSNAVNAVIGDSQGVGTITNDDVVTPAVSVPPSATPGGTFVAAVTNGPANRLDWVGLYPVGGSAASRIDWFYLNGSKTAPGSGTATASVTFNSPTAAGNYQVRLFANDTTTLLATSGTVTVSQASSLSIDDVSLAEGNSGTRTATFTVTLSPVNASQTVTVNYATANGTATAGSDYVATSGTLSFSAGQSSRTFIVTINGDTTNETNETFLINLSGSVNALIGDAQAVGTITNDDTPPAPSVSVPASASSGSTFTATISNGPGNRTDWVGFYPVGGSAASRIDWKYLNNQRNAPASGLSSAAVTFVAPTAPGNYEVRLFANDSTTLLAASGAVNVAAPPPSPSLSIGDVSVTEGNAGTTVATFTVTLSPVNGSQTVTVNYATANGTATAGSDYVAASGTLTFTSGQSARTFTVTINGDTASEANETFVVDLSGVTNAVIGDAQGIGTIINDDAPAGPAASVPASAAPSTTFTASISNGPGNSRDWVGFFPVGGSTATRIDWKYLNDLKTAPTTGVSTSSVTFAAPATPGNYEVRLFANDSNTLLATSGAMSVAVAPPSPTLSIANVSISEGNSGTATATFTVTLSPTTSQTVSVNYATANGTATAGTDYVAANGTLNFSAGAATRTFTVTINGDTTAEAHESFLVNLSGAVNAVIGDGQAVGTISNDDAPAGPAVSLPPTAAPGATFTATVSGGPASARDWLGFFPAGGTPASRLDWKYLNNSKTAPTTGLSSAAVTFVAPSTPGNYEVRLFANDSNTVLATSGAITVSATPPSPALSIADVSVTEGNAGTTLATFTVTLSPVNASQTVTVDYATANGSATTAGGDYVAAAGTLTFSPSTPTQTFSVTINGDATMEPTESFVVNLSDATNALIADPQATGTIVNDDGSIGPAVTPAANTVQVGTSVDFAVSGGPGNLRDWVAFALSSAPDSGYVDWNYLHGAKNAPSNGFSGASLRFTAPSTPGTYVVRFFSNDTLNKLAQSVTITVVP